jgi:hypothetical protein
MQVYPMMVVEEITKRTLQGEVTNYVLQGGSDPSVTVLLNQVDGEIFESADEAKYVLTSRATSQIERLVDSAITKANEWYSSSVPETTRQEGIMELSQVTSEPNLVKVELPDGTVANLKVS